MTAEEAAYIMMSGGGGGSQTEEKYDRIAGLPTVFAFDMADGWRCELCADSNPTDCPTEFTYRGDNWSEEFQSTVIFSKTTKAYYLRIFSGSELKLVTDTQPYMRDQHFKWYATNGTVIGDLMKNGTSKYSNFSLYSIGKYYGAIPMTPPNITLGYTLTQTINGTAEIYNNVTNMITTKFISKGDIDVNVYADFVNAVRKFSDEFNSNNAT